MSWLPWLGCFAIAAVLDFVWAAYIRTIADKAALRAGLWAVAIILLGGINAIGYIQNHWLLLPIAAGAFVGTYAHVALEARK